MLKVAVFTVLALTSYAVFADETESPSACVDAEGHDLAGSPKKFLAAIAAQSECADAANLAEKCAFGSSLDSQTAGVAIEVCNKKRATYPKSALNEKLLAAMKQTCDDRYAHEDGTLYQSMNAYCQMNAVKWITELAEPDEN